MVHRVPIELGNALRELARQDPYAAPGYLWKNPFNPRAKGRRWTPRTLEFFQRWQQYERENLEELAAQTTVTNTYLPVESVPLSPPPSLT
jgi:hypothetical protein